MMTSDIAANTLKFTLTEGNKIQFYIHGTILTKYNPCHVFHKLGMFQVSVLTAKNCHTKQENEHDLAITK